MRNIARRTAFSCRSLAYYSKVTIKASKLRVVTFRIVSVTKDAKGVTKMAACEHLRRASAANAGSFVACALYEDSSDDSEDEEPVVEPWESKKRLHGSTVFCFGPPEIFSFK